MTRLLRVELTRFRSRRFTLVATLGIFAVALLLLFSAWDSSRPASASEVANFNASVQDWEENGDQYIAECLEGEKADAEINPGADWGCDGYAAPQLADFTSRSPTFADSAVNVLPTFGLVLVLAAFAMGVSFIAAEFSSGAIGNWLTFEPRRGRVYGTKVGASGLAVLPIAVVAGAFVVGGVWLVNSLNEHLGTVTADTWRDVAVSGSRVLAATVAFAVLGVALGAIVRHTAAALGIVLGYTLVVEGIVGGLFQWTQPWLLQLNLRAILENGAAYGRSVCENGPSGQTCSWVETTVSFGHGATVVGVVVGVAVLVAALVFRRRDVS